MTDKELASIAYMIVHDWQVEVIEEARAELKHKGRSAYRDNVSAIHNWSTKEGFAVIARHARKTLKCIDAETFSIDDV